MNNISAFETEAINLVTRVIKSRLKEFAALGLEIKLIGPKRRFIDTLQYESEIEIRFLGTEGIFDMLEFHLYLNGQPVSSLPEIEAWLEENIDDVVDKVQDIVYSKKEGE